MSGDESHNFENLVISQSTKQTEYGKRRKSYDEKKFDFSDTKDAQSNGWVESRRLKSGVKMRRPKSAIEIVQNRFWSVLYKLGYEELNTGKSFSIPIKMGKEKVTTNVDVFAKDSETVIVARCWSFEKPRKRSMGKDLDALQNEKRLVANAIRQYYGKEFKPKILWFFVTNNIRWSDSDIAKAEAQNTHVVQARELLYFEEFSKKLGNASRYQFQAEYLAGQSIPALKGRKLPAVATKLGGKRVYIFSAKAVDILRIAFVNHRDLRDPSGAPSYQRLVNPNRLKQIGKFLNEGGNFPNTVLLNFHVKPRFDKIGSDTSAEFQFGELYLPDKYKSCWIVDGQHRLYGCTAAENIEKLPNLFFIAFDGMSAVDEANTFATINEKQTKVPKKLIAELDGDIKWDSKIPKDRLLAIASRTVDLLNTKGSSPFENKVVTPGVSASTSQPLTLPQIQQAITQSKLIGSVCKRTGQILPGPCWDKNSEGSLMRMVAFLSWHFGNIEQANSDRWHAGKTEYLCSNFGVASHIRLLAELTEYVSQKEHFNPVESELTEIEDALEAYLKPIIEFIGSASKEEFENRFKVPFGSGGLPRYFFKLVELVRSKYPEWEPEGYEEYIQTITDEEAKQADEDVKWIQTVVPQYVIAELKKMYGNKFFEKGVPKATQKACQSKRIEDDPDKQYPVETYLDWIQIKGIVEQKSLKSHFAPALSIRLPEEGRQKAIHLMWFDVFNEIRRIPAHPMGRFYKEDDLEFLKTIKGFLTETLSELDQGAS